jgi:Mn-containing catalase
MDGGDGTSSVKLQPGQKDVLKQMASRTRSDPALDPRTGAELGTNGAKPGARH